MRIDQVARTPTERPLVSAAMAERSVEYTSTSGINSAIASSERLNIWATADGGLIM